MTGKISLKALLALMIFFEQEPTWPQQEDAGPLPNIVFIAVDDLRPELGCYGQPQILSPNLDRLAEEGYLFERAYCNVPVCGASRASLLTGLRPRPGRFLNYHTYANEDAPGTIALPAYFRQNGYYTLSLGKVFHHIDDKLGSWNEPPWHPVMDHSKEFSWRNYQLPANQAMDQAKGKRGPAFERAEVSDTAYYDGKMARRAIKKLRDMSGRQEPFFMALGFVKPHLPFNAPAKYWDLYSKDNIKLPTYMKYPEAAPREAHYNYHELRSYSNIPNTGSLPSALALQLIHGYYACVSYVDAMVGLVLDEVKRLKLEDDTIILLWGDHGWSLGEHGLWCKHSTFDVAMRTPILIKVPGRRGGQRVHALTEFVDIYPTLCELAGLPLPGHLQGDSFVPLLDEPSAKGKPAIFCRWKRSDAIKTDRYLYTRWFDDDHKPGAHMLYDHYNDPGETVNLADQPAHKERVKKLTEALLQQRKAN